LRWYYHTTQPLQGGAEMSSHRFLNEAILQSLGLSVESAKIVMDRIIELEDSVEFYKRRVDLLLANQRILRDPERKIVCDILANGNTENNDNNQQSACCGRPPRDCDCEPLDAPRIKGC